MFKNIELIKLLKQLVTKQHHVYTQFNTKHGKPITKSNVTFFKIIVFINIGYQKSLTLALTSCWTV